MTQSIDLVCGHDPGASGCGYSVWSIEANAPIYIGAEPPKFAVDVAVVESGFIGKMGKKAMWGLGFSAGAALAWMHAQHTFKFGCDLQCFTIRPDGRLGWRAALPERAGFKQFDGLPGDVIVNRLRARYDLSAVPGAFDYHTEHEVEAVGIAEAAAAILQRPKASARRALVKVKR